MTPTTLEEGIGQFYVLHGNISGHTVELGTRDYTFPLVFIVMEHRTQSDYEEVFDFLTSYWRKKVWELESVKMATVFLIWKLL